MIYGELESEVDKRPLFRFKGDESSPPGMDLRSEYTQVNK
jgi:hypothetical protein